MKFDKLMVLKVGTLVLSGIVGLVQSHLSDKELDKKVAEAVAEALKKN